jgi:transcriptional regulator with XRE-family HTH domain
MAKRGRPAGSSEGAREAVQEILAARRTLQLSENQLAAQVGLNQSTVNRVLRAENPVWTPALARLCNYAKNAISPQGGGAESGDRVLLAALLNLWDGTAVGADRLLRLLRCVDEIRAEGKAKALTSGRDYESSKPTP